MATDVQVAARKVTSVNPATGAKGAPTPDYTEFETFTVTRRRSDGRL